MEFSNVVKQRRSCRKYTDEIVPPEIVETALKDAIIAPNSSNMQLMKFYWIHDKNKKSQLVEACLNQSAARTSQELIVAVADWSQHRQNAKKIISDFVKPQNSPDLLPYYEKLVPIMYTYGFFNIIGYIKMIILYFIGLFRPIMRGPATKNDVAMVAVKSTALACENLMLSIYNQGYACCPMEGFDECRVNKIIGKSGCTSRVVIIISIGKPDWKGLLPQFRFDYSHFVEKI